MSPCTRERERDRERERERERETGEHTRGFQSGRGALGSRWRDAHLGGHTPPPGAGLGHGQSALLAWVLTLACWGGGGGVGGRLPLGARIHGDVQLLVHLLQIFCSSPAAADLMLCMLV